MFPSNCSFCLYTYTNMLCECSPLVVSLNSYSRFVSLVLYCPDTSSIVKSHRYSNGGSWIWNNSGHSVLCIQHFWAVVASLIGSQGQYEFLYVHQRCSRGFQRSLDAPLSCSIWKKKGVFLVSGRARVWLCNPLEQHHKGRGGGCGRVSGWVCVWSEAQKVITAALMVIV